MLEILNTSRNSFYYFTLTECSYGAFAGFRSQCFPSILIEVYIILSMSSGFLE